MNSCLQKPCRQGFAFHDIVPFQLDYYGGFSFSTTGGISGMEYNATAFVGCDNGYCCGCYGPVGGRKDYCAENCKAINGGTVTKNVFTWFWVRSSLPKRLWKKCMDYQVKKNDGKLISYKLIGHSVIPVQGSCSKDSTLLHDGIVVVPDSSAAQKVPAIDGLLEYRKDKQELYVRSNKTWNVLAPENKILQKTNKQDKLNLDKIKKLEKHLKNEKTIILQETDKRDELNFEKIKKLEQKLNNETKIIVQETDKKHKSNLDKIKKLEHNLNNGTKIIIQETDKKHKLNLDKIKKLEHSLNNGTKIIIQEMDKKFKLNLDKIKNLEQSLSNETKTLKNLIRNHDSEVSKLQAQLLSQRKECFGYKWLRESNRNQKYSSGYNCDKSLSTGWYRFGGGAGIKMPTSCVSKNRCGTRATGWMNGAHPTVVDGKVTRKVCYNWIGNCCNWSNNIEVVNCRNYYVYKLSRPSAGCTLRYCGSDN